MTRNLISPRSRWRATQPMAAHDTLPAELRLWIARAALPWSAASVLRIWQRALRETGCPAVACTRLDAAEARTLAREARRVWGTHHPAAQTKTAPELPGPPFNSVPIRPAASQTAGKAA